MSITVAEIHNPQVLTVPAVQDLFRRAYSTHPVAAGAFDEDPDAFVGLLLSPHAGVFIGAEDGQLKALSIISLPTSVIGPLPVVDIAYNEGSKGLKKAMLEKGFEFLKEKGYNKVAVINGSGRSDKAWLKAFGLPKEPKVLGTWFEIEF